MKSFNLDSTANLPYFSERNSRMWVQPSQEWSKHISVLRKVTEKQQELGHQAQVEGKPQPDGTRKGERVRNRGK